MSMPASRRVARRVVIRPLRHHDACLFDVVLSSVRTTVTLEDDLDRMKVSPMRAKPEIDLTKALRLAGELEDEEIARKLEQGR